MPSPTRKLTSSSSTRPSGSSTDTCATSTYPMPPVSRPPSPGFRGRPVPALGSGRAADSVDDPAGGDPARLAGLRPGPLAELAGRAAGGQSRGALPGALPDPDDPRLDAWLSAVDTVLTGLPDGGFDVVCHSLAALLWLHRATRGSAGPAPARVLLAAPPSPRRPEPELAASCRHRWTPTRCGRPPAAPSWSAATTTRTARRAPGRVRAAAEAAHHRDPGWRAPQRGRGLRAVAGTGALVLAAQPGLPALTRTPDRTPAANPGGTPAGAQQNQPAWTQPCAFTCP